MDNSNIVEYVSLFLFSIVIIIVIAYSIMYILGKGPFKPFCDIHSDICKHNGTCISLSHETYKCESCDSGWTGPDCDKPDVSVISKRPCSIDPDRCFHNGICTNIDLNGNGIMDDFKCNHCDTGWKGKTCNEPDGNFDIDIECNSEGGEKQKDLKFCESRNKCFSTNDWDINCPEACPGSGITMWCPDFNKCINRVLGEVCPSFEIDLYDRDCRKSERWNNSINDCECDSTFDCDRISLDSGSHTSTEIETNKNKCNKLRCCKWRKKNNQCKYHNWYDDDGRSRHRNRIGYRNNFEVGGFSEY